MSDLEYYKQLTPIKKKNFLKNVHILLYKDSIDLNLLCNSHPKEYRYILRRMNKTIKLLNTISRLDK